jgi:hypothetical protein
VIHEMNSEEWESGNGCLAFIFVFVIYYIYVILLPCVPCVLGDAKSSGTGPWGSGLP